MKQIYAAGLAFGLLAMVSPGDAASIVFSGSRTNVDAPGTPAARCGARTTTSVRHDPPTATSLGFSNFGGFTPTLSHCIQLPLAMVGPSPFDLGEFVFDFASGDSLFGTYSGSLSPLSPGQFSVSQTHMVTGGTGFLAGATGSFDSSGTLSFLTGRPVVSQTFSGVLNVAAVPEPAAWAMMIVGFGVVGGAIRSRRRQFQALSFA